MQDIHDREASIKPNEIRQLERTHGDVGAILHDSVDGIPVSDAGFEADDCFVDVGHQDAVGEETGGVDGVGDNFTHFLDEGDGGGEGGGGGLEAGDDFDTFLDRDGVHEVGCYYAGGGGGVERFGGVLGGGGNTWDGCQHGVVGSKGLGESYG